ncbi:MAG: 30S ribosomal protein S20 [Desulfobacterales bacterium CG2_30_60_27]|nr:MAG: 30S ribosomal protein S20 [Desulfobacterales bacterium CG2_30_60_27]
MANHKSALKRNRQAQLGRVRNKANRTRVKNVVRAVDEAIGEKSVEMAQAALKLAIPAIQKAASKGAFHKKNASRKVSRLTKRVNAFAATA